MAKKETNFSQFNKAGSKYVKKKKTTKSYSSSSSSSTAPKAEPKAKKHEKYTGGLTGKMRYRQEKIKGI